MEPTKPLNLISHWRVSLPPLAKQRGTNYLFHLIQAQAPNIP